jgi:hypothetical protein
MTNLQVNFQGRSIQLNANAVASKGQFQKRTTECRSHAIACDLLLALCKEPGAPVDPAGRNIIADPAGRKCILTPLFANTNTFYSCWCFSNHFLQASYIPIFELPTCMCGQDIDLINSFAVAMNLDTQAPA